MRLTKLKVMVRTPNIVFHPDGYETYYCGYHRCERKIEQGWAHCPNCGTLVDGEELENLSYYTGDVNHEVK